MTRMIQATRPARMETRRLLRLLLAHPSQSAAGVEAQVTGFIEYARAMRLDLSRQWWCEDAGRIAGACVWIQSPGRTAMVFLPHSKVLALGGGVLGRLLAEVRREAAQERLALLQSLLYPEDAAHGSLLVREGFRRIAELIYLERDTISADENGVAGRVDWGGTRPEWLSYSPKRHAQFAETILLTYEGSRDCAAMAGLRSIEDIIAGHKSAGIFEPHRWRLLCIDGRTAGCILLSVNPLQPVLEVVYVGICPQFRGRGLGRLLMMEALAEAHRDGLQKVTLAVDAENGPALKVYNCLKFRESTRRTAWMLPLTPTLGARGT